MVAFEPFANESLLLDLEAWNQTVNRQGHEPSKNASEYRDWIGITQGVTVWPDGEDMMVGGEGYHYEGYSDWRKGGVAAGW